MIRRLLVVDDDKLMRFAVMGIRRRLGFQIDSACGGWDALEMIRANEPYHVILSDFDMPVMDGIELLERCRERAPASIRLLVSALERDDRIDAALVDGVISDFIQKPFTPHRLGKYLDAAMRQYEQQQAASSPS